MIYVNNPDLRGSFRLEKTGLGGFLVVVTLDIINDSDARFVADRVFIAGDAAHTMPPTGGFGGNTGIKDAHNLAWKIALVVKGLAGTQLLDTYDAERQPAGMQAIEQAYNRSRHA